MKKESSYQRLKRKLAESEESVRQLRADLKSVILADGNKVRAHNVINRVAMEDDLEKVVWYGDGTQSGQTVTGGIYAVMTREKKPVKPEMVLERVVSVASAHEIEALKNQFEKTVFGMDWAQEGTVDESAIVAWTPEGAMTREQLAEWLKLNSEEDESR
jgi:hypothetical protein